MGQYALPGNVALSTAYKTAASMAATAGVLARGKLIDVLFGAQAVPNATDCNITFSIARQTSPSTNATAFTANPTDPADSTCRMTCAITAVTEGVITANSDLVVEGMNQRNSVRWNALDEAKALIWPASASNGLVVRALSPNFTGSFGANCMFLEG